MEKTVFSKEHKAMLALLREKRLAASVTQIDLADKLNITQSAYSKLERGELRVDLIQLRQICQAINIDLVMFVKELEQRLVKKRKRRSTKKKRTR